MNRLSDRGNQVGVFYGNVDVYYSNHQIVAATGPPHQNAPIQDDRRTFSHSSSATGCLAPSWRITEPFRISRGFLSRKRRCNMPSDGPRAVWGRPESVSRGGAWSEAAARRFIERVRHHLCLLSGENRVGAAFAITVVIDTRQLRYGRRCHRDRSRMERCS